MNLDGLNTNALAAIYFSIGSIRVGSGKLCRIFVKDTRRKILDIRILKEFVAEVLTVCKYDYDCVTAGLEDKAFQAGAELGIPKEELERLLNGETEDR